MLPRASVAKAVRVGDVVAFTSPLTPELDDAANAVLVRRVVAVEGDELVASPSSSQEGDGASSAGDEEVLVVPQGHCWVLADNEDLKPPQVSRSVRRVRLGVRLGCIPTDATRAGVRNAYDNRML